MCMVKKRVNHSTSSPKRSLVKAISWESISFIITLIAVYFLYGDLKVSIEFTFVLTVIKIIFLYFHERIWKKVSWGKTHGKINSRT